MREMKVGRESRLTFIISKPKGVRSWDVRVTRVPVADAVKMLPAEFARKEKLRM